MKTILVDLNLCLGCKTCEIQCATKRVSESNNLREAVLEIPRLIPRISVQYDGQVSALSNVGNVKMRLIWTSVLLVRFIEKKKKERLC